MKTVAFLLGLLAFNLVTYSQNVSITDDGSLPDGSAMLDIKSISKGVLFPRMTQAQRNAINQPATGLLIYQLDQMPGFYINTGTTISPAWQQLSSAGSAWQKTGNAGTVAGTNFIGTTDNQPLVFKMNNIQAGRIETNNLFLGLQAGLSNTALYNTGIGKNALYYNNTGSENTALGFGTLFANTSGLRNTSVGSFALSDNTTGHRNTATGSLALTTNTEGSYNTANGCAALHSNNTGFENSALGYGALYGNTSGYGNTSMGFLSMYNNQLGYYNTALGHGALYANVAGLYNTANGWSALTSNNYGASNTANGVKAMRNNIGGDNNTSVGADALYANEYGDYNTAVGSNTLGTNINGSNNTALGANATTGGTLINNSTAIGANALANTSNLMAFGSGTVTKWVFGRNNTSDINYALQVGFDATNGSGAFLTNGGTWTNISDKHKKIDFSIPDGKEVLGKVISLPISKWRYVGTGEYHIGPMAQDFYKQFGLGIDDKSISTIDPAGVLFIAIQEQQNQIEELKRELEALKKLIGTK